MIKVKSPIGLFIQLKLDNKIIEPFRRSHSWTRNHWRFIFCGCSGYPNKTADSLNLIDVAGASVAIDGSVTTQIKIDQVADVKAVITDDDIGIVVGTDDTAEAFADYALGAKIAHGTGSGQLQYGAMATVGVSGNKKITQSRFFTNGSGASITVKEIGLIFNALKTDDSSSHKVLMARDVLSSGVAVANGQVFGVEYYVTISFP